MPLLFAGYVAAFLDRVNVGFAKLQMAGDLHFSDAVYGFGAGIFFIGYFVFEVPSNLMLERVGARIWIVADHVYLGAGFGGVRVLGACAGGPSPRHSDERPTVQVLRSALPARRWPKRDSSRASSSTSLTGFPPTGAPRMVALFMSAIGGCQR